jgi:hypothetical protein
MVLIQVEGGHLCCATAVPHQLQTSGSLALNVRFAQQTTRGDAHSRLARAGRNGSVRCPQRGYQSVTHDSLPLGPVNSAVGSQKVRRKCARAHCRVDGARGWENGATMMPRAATDPVDGSVAAQEVTVGSACRHSDIVCTVDGKQRAFELPPRRSVDALQSVD